MKYAHQLAEVQIQMARWWDYGSGNVQHLVTDALRDGTYTLKEVAILFQKATGSALSSFPLTAVRELEAKGFTQARVNQCIGRYNH